MKKTKRITAAVLAAMLLALSLFSAYAEPQTKTEIYSENSAGETVVRIQIRLRELGYLWFKPTGVYRAMTVKAVEEFQTRCVAYGERLGVDGRMGEQSMLELFAPSAPKFRIPDSVHLPRGPIADTLKVKGEVQSWNAVKQKLNVNEEYTVIDCNTGKEFKLVFTGGENHAEAETASESELQFNAIRTAAILWRITAWKGMSACSLKAVCPMWAACPMLNIMQMFLRRRAEDKSKRSLLSFFKTVINSAFGHFGRDALCAEFLISCIEKDVLLNDSGKLADAACGGLNF